MVKKIIVTILFLIMTFIFLPDSGNSLSNNFIDMPDDWSTMALQNAVENGLLKGHDNRIKPNENITRAEIATVINRAFGVKEIASLKDFVDVKSSDWYYYEMAKAVKMGTFEGSGNHLNPNDPITREETFAVIARALKLKPAENISEDFTDINEISNWAIDEINSLINNGYISGSNGKLNPKEYITRAEFAQVMDNIVKKYINFSGKQSIQVKGNVMINTSDVTLQESLVTGDLIIGDGVGDGEVLLDNIEVEGRLLVRGGGENSIVISGNTIIGSITIARIDGSVRVHSEDGSEVGEVIVDGNDDVTLEGKFDGIDILGNGITINLNDAEVINVTIAGEGSKVSIEETTTIEKLNVKGLNNTVAVFGSVEQLETYPLSIESKIIVNKDGEVKIIIVNNEGTIINDEGEVGEVFANANNTIIKSKNTKVNVAEGIEGTVAGDEEIEAGHTYDPSENKTIISDDSSHSTNAAVNDINITTNAIDDSSVPNSDSVKVTLETSTIDATIHYTTDGSTPESVVIGETKLYTPASKPSISTDNIFGESIILKAKGFKSGMLDSDLAEKVIVFNAASTVSVSSAEAFESAIESNMVETITVTKDFTGDVTATRSGSTDLMIDFADKTMIGNLNINTDNLTALTFNGTVNPSITGNLTVKAGVATVTNNINVGGNITVSDVSSHSWVEEANGNSIILTDSNGATIVINGNPNDISVSSIADGGVNITVNSPVTITLEAGSNVNSITASGTASGTTIINNGKITSVIADADIDVENNSGDISVTGTGTVAVSGTKSENVTGTTVVIGLTDLDLDQIELRIGSITEANITTSVSGASYNVTSENPSVISVNDSTGLGIKANEPGRVAVVVQVKDIEGNVTHQGTIFITVLPELITAGEVTMVAPVLGETPQTSTQIEAATGNEDYTVTNVSWNEPLTAAGKFKAEENYTATITLVSKDKKAFSIDAFTPSVIGSKSVGVTTTLGNDIGNKTTFTATFPTTGTLEVTSIEVTTQPTKMIYTEETDDVLTLVGMVITETNNDGSKNIVNFLDGTALGYTSNPVNGSSLTYAEHDGNPVVITHTASSAAVETEDFTVTSALSFEKIIEVHHQVIIPVDPYSGLVNGPRKHQPFTVTTQIDAETPNYYEMLMTGENSDFLINYYRMNSAGIEECYFSIKLKDAIIVYIKHNKPNALMEDNRVYEDMITLSFTYSNITWTDELNGYSYSDSW